MKLAAIKSELEKKTAHWRNEWKSALTKWMNAIYAIYDSSTINSMFILPTDDKSRYTFFITNRADMTIDTPKSLYRIKDLESAMTYYYGYDAGYLIPVPINLMVDIFRYLISVISTSTNNDDKGTGEHFSTILTNEDYRDNLFNQYFWLGAENERHHELIRSVMTSSKDNWLSSNYCQIRVGERLPSVCYIRQVLEKIKLQQVEKMIECQFRSRDCADELLTTAKRFSSLVKVDILYGSEMSAFISPDVIRLLGSCSISNSAIGTRRIDEDVNERKRETMKAFDFADENDKQHKHWILALENPDFVRLLNGKLTAADVRFILCCNIDAYCDSEKVLKQIRHIESETSQHFKMARKTNVLTFVDEFFNFGFSHARGFFAESILSRKLAAHALELDAIRKISDGIIDNNGNNDRSTFADIAPAALVEIVTHYLFVSP